MFACTHVSKDTYFLYVFLCLLSTYMFVCPQVSASRICETNINLILNNSPTRKSIEPAWFG